MLPKGSDNYGDTQGNEQELFTQDSIMLKPAFSFQPYIKDNAP